MPEPNHIEAIARQLLEESIAGNKETVLRCEGFSMEPMVVSGDEVYFKKSNMFRFGDLVVYKKNGDYIVHRFMGKRIIDNQETYLLKADNITHFDEPVAYTQVLGRVTRLKKNGKIINLESLAGRCVSLSYFLYADFLRLAKITRNERRKDFADEKRLVQLIAGGGMPEEFIALLSGTLNWDYLFEKIKWNFISPLFLSKAKELGITEKIPLDILKEFENINGLQLVSDTRKRHLLLEVLNAFNASGIRALLSKGIHLGSEVYEDSYQRWMGDIDIMVEPKDWVRARRILGDIGFSGSQEPYLGCDEWGIRYLDNHIDFQKNGLRLEVKANNWALEVPYFDYSLWKDAREYRFGEAHCYVPSYEDTLLIACINLIRHNFEGLIWFIDIKKIIEAYGDRIDWQTLVTTARRYDIDTIVYYALYFTEELCGIANAGKAYARLQPGKVRQLLFRFFWNKEAILLRRDGRTCKAKIPFECALILFGGKFSFQPFKISHYVSYLFKLVFAPPGYLKEKYRRGSFFCVYEAYLLRLRKLFLAVLQTLGNLALGRN
ncbi:MAG: nucleotidyltransferase family protein [Candidatus Omnitrophota bacterium]